MFYDKEFRKHFLKAKRYLFKIIYEIVESFLRVLQTSKTNVVFDSNMLKHEYINEEINTLIVEYEIPNKLCILESIL
jgi:hypothetical protein